MGSLGWQELMIILVIVMVIFGAGKLPEIGGSLGKSIKEFKSESADEPLTGRSSGGATVSRRETAPHVVERREMRAEEI